MVASISSISVELFLREGLGQAIDAVNPERSKRRKLNGCERARSKDTDSSSSLRSSPYILVISASHSSKEPVRSGASLVGGTTLRRETRSP